MFRRKPLKLNFTILSCLLISLFSFASLLYNGTDDKQFVIYPISMVLIFSASNYIIDENMDFNKITRLIIWCGIIQNILSLMMFFNPQINSFLNEIQIISDADIGKLEEFNEFRILGFGSSFFSSGIINSILLLLCSYIILIEENRSKRTLWILAFIIIAFIGILKARTVFIGIILSFLYMLFTSAKRLFAVLFITIIFSVIISSLISLLFPDVVDQFEILLNFGFELFIKYFEFGSFESNSTNDLQEMYVYPQYLKTYIIGDGKWNDTVNGAYYMGTDIGYLRLVFYFGILGCVLFFSFQFSIIYKLFNRNNSWPYRSLIISLFVLLILLNFKGFTDFFFIFILLILSKPSYVQRT